jgi:hypothetical protein
MQSNEVLRGPPVSLAVRFHAVDDRPQTELKEVLERELNHLFEIGIIRNIRLEPVFPGDETVQWRGAFIIDFVGDSDLAVRTLRMIVGVRMVHIIDERITR